MHPLYAIAMGFCLINCFMPYQTAHGEQARVVILHWYMHDTPLSGPNASSIPVTAFNLSDIQNEVNNFLFGQIYVIDDLLTVGASITSQSFGRTQGTYTFVSKEEIVSFVSYTVRIQAGEYNGSSINILGSSRNSDTVKKYVIVGGTGKFALARGILSEVVVNVFGPLSFSATLTYNATIYLPSDNNY